MSMIKYAELSGNYLIIAASIIFVVAFILRIIGEKNDNYRGFAYTSVTASALLVMFRIGDSLKGTGAGKYTYYINGIKAGSGFFFLFEWFFVFMVILFLALVIVEKLSGMIGKKIWKKEEQKKLIIILSVIAILLAVLVSGLYLSYALKGVIRFKLLKMGLTKPVLSAMSIAIIMTGITIFGIVKFIKYIKNK